MIVSIRNNGAYFTTSRESVTNNRIKSGYENRVRAPIDTVPLAGARSGHADGVETTRTRIGNLDSQLEEGEALTTHKSPILK